MRILLFRPDKSGDALKTLPVLRAIVKRAEIQWSIYLSDENFSVLEFEKGIELFNRNSFSGKFDKAISLLCDPDQKILETFLSIPSKQYFSFLKNLPSDFSKRGIQSLVLPENSPVGRDETVNIALLLRQVIGSFNYDPTPIPPVFSKADEQEANAKLPETSNTRLGICPFSGLPHRQFPLVRWEKIIARLARQNIFSELHVFGLPKDLEKIKLPAGVSTHTPSSFRTLGCYLKKMDGVLAVDSGPLHLARTLGLPVVGILSGGDLERWFPNPKAYEKFVKRGLFGKFPSTFVTWRTIRAWSKATLTRNTLA